MKLSSAIQPKEENLNYSHPGAVYYKKHVKIWVCHIAHIEEKAGQFSGVGGTEFCDKKTEEKIVKIICTFVLIIMGKEGAKKQVTGFYKN